MSCVLVVFMIEILLRQFQPKQVSLSSLGEPYRGGKDSCRVFILYMYILYLHELVLIAKWLTRGMIILQMGDNHDNENHEALPQQPPSLAQAVAALIADRNEQTELIRQLVQAQANVVEVDTLPRHHQQKLTMSVFWSPSLLCSTRPMIPWSQMLGFTPLRISSASSIAQKWTKPPLQHNS